MGRSSRAPIISENEEVGGPKSVRSARENVRNATALHGTRFTHRYNKNKITLIPATSAQAASGLSRKRANK
jgi:hypothetical protein